MNIEREMRRGIIKQIKQDGQIFAWCPICYKVCPVEIEHIDKDDVFVVKRKCKICLTEIQEEIKKVKRIFTRKK